MVSFLGGSLGLPRVGMPAVRGMEQPAFATRFPLSGVGSFSVAQGQNGPSTLIKVVWLATQPSATMAAIERGMSRGISGRTAESSRYE